MSWKGGQENEYEKRDTKHGMGKKSEDLNRMRVM